MNINLNVTLFVVISALISNSAAECFLIDKNDKNVAIDQFPEDVIKGSIDKLEKRLASTFDKDNQLLVIKKLRK